MPLENQKIYFNYWGKAKKNPHADIFDCHLLALHSLDVSAVGYEFLRQNPSVLNGISQRLGIKPDLFHKYFSFMLALHDVGKFADSFQNLRPGVLKNLQGRKSGRRYHSGYKHDSLGFQLWGDNTNGIKKLLQEEGLLPKEQASWRRQLDLERPLDIWMGAVAGHHGRPPKSHTNRLPCDDFNGSDYKAVSLFVKDLIPVLLPDRTQFPDCDMQRAKTASWDMAGLAVLCDWLGSNTKFFPYQEQAANLNEYWKEACEKAKKAGREINILNARPAANCLKIEELLESAQNCKLSPLQSFVSQLKIPPSPHLFVLEDVTGSGKTEAALLLAHKLMKAGQAGGLYFALPTMATSNAMYSRIKRIYRKMFDPPVSLVLSHSARAMVGEFTRSVLPEVLETESHYKDQIPAGFHCRAWLTDNRKKALLADVGVGTVDQALLAVLPVRHQALRLLGLSNKILIVDEVHACDAYMNKLLCVLLSAHARAGGSAIFLSATLPQKQRQEFLDSWAVGRCKPLQKSKKRAYPLISCLYDKGLWEENPDLETDTDIVKASPDPLKDSLGAETSEDSGNKEKENPDTETNRDDGGETFKTGEESSAAATDRAKQDKFEGKIEESLSAAADTPPSLESRQSFEETSRTNKKRKEEDKMKTTGTTVKPVEFFSNKDFVEKLLSLVVRKKLCACWIRNTVKDAVSTYEDLKTKQPDWDISLFHARFALGDRLEIEKGVVGRFGKNSRAGDRRGKILIATQTVEQSLDLDFDVLISDLAPVDLLIQRAGRLKRHTRDQAGNPISGEDKRGPGRFYIHSPEWTPSPDKNWYADFFPNARKIYPDHGQLWLTAKGLKKRGGLKIPEDSRLLIEGVYGEHAADKIPETLRPHNINAEGENSAAKSIAGWNALSIKNGYVDSNDKWEDEGETPTRLGERTTTVYLALWGDGKLQAYFSSEGKPMWPLSSVSVRLSDIKTEAENPAIPLKLIEECRKNLPAEGRWGGLLPLAPIPNSQGNFQGFAKDQNDRKVCWIYSKKTGLRRRILKKSR